MESQKTYLILVLMNATPKWLSLSRDSRSNFFEKQVVPIIERVAPTVRVRFCDSEYFHARVSDYMFIETESLEQYQLLIELMRDTKIYSEPYFEVVDVIVGRENAFRDFNELLKTK